MDFFRHRRSDTAVRAAALAAGGFATRQLAEPVYLSELVSARSGRGRRVHRRRCLRIAARPTDPVQLLTALLNLSGVRQAIRVAAARYVDGITDGVVPDRKRPDVRVGHAYNDRAPTWDHRPRAGRAQPRPGPLVLSPDATLTVQRGIHPAQLAVFAPSCRRPSS